MSPIGRVRLHVSELCRVPVDPTDVYYLEALGGCTREERKEVDKAPQKAATSVSLYR